MDKTVLVYRSRTGFTRRYAQRIAQETGCALLPDREAGADRLAGCRTLIFGTRVHASRIDGLGRARKLLRQSGAERLVLFVTGAMPGDAAEAIEALWTRSLTPAELESVPHFYLQGGLCYERLGPVDWLMMKTAAAFMKNSVDLPGGEFSITRSFDCWSEANLTPILSYLRG